MVRPLRHKDYDIPWTTPESAEGIKLYHNRDLSSMERDRFMIGSAKHRLATLYLWKWAVDEPKREAQVWQKDQFMQRVFYEDVLERREVTKIFVGKMLSWSLLYSPRFQSVTVEHGSVMCWRFRHPADVRYGMEHQIAFWYAQFCARVAMTHDTEEDVSETDLRRFLEDELPLADKAYISDYFGPGAEKGM